MLKSSLEVESGKRYNVCQHFYKILISGAYFQEGRGFSEIPGLRRAKKKNKNLLYLESCKKLRATRLYGRRKVMRRCTIMGTFEKPMSERGGQKRVNLGGVCSLEGQGNISQLRTGVWREGYWDGKKPVCIYNRIMV